MASAVERLKFVLSVDADGAIKSFEKVGNTAEKELRRAETGMQKAGGQLTKFGAGATAAAGIAGVALFSLSKKYEDAVLEAGKLSKATGLTVEQASRWVDVANDAGVETATFEGALGKMTKLLGTSSAKFDELGIATADASGKTLSANDIFLNSVEALNGISDPFVRAKAASDIFGKGFQGIAELTGKSADDLRARLESVGDQQVFDDADLDGAEKYRDSLKDLSDAFGQMTLAIGKGAAPVFGVLADALTGAVNGFTQLDGLSNGLVGKLGAIAAVGVGVVGAISTVAGSVIKMSGRFKDADGALTGFGKTAKGVGGIAVGLGAALAVGQIADAFTQDVSGAEKALNKFIVTSKGVQGTKNQTTDLTQAWKDMSEEADKSQGIFSRTFGDLGHAFDQSGENLAHLQKGFDSILKTSPDMANQLVDALERMDIAAKNGDASAKGWLDSNSLSTNQIKKLRDEVTNATGAQDILTKYTGAGTVEEQKAAEANKERTDALEAESKALEEHAKLLLEQIDAQRSAADAVYALRDAQDTFTESLDGTAKAVADANGDVGKIAKVYRDVATNAAAVADGTNRVYEEQLAANGVVLDAVTGMDLWNNSMLTAAGTARGEARSAIIEFLALRNNIPPELMTDIRAAVDAGDLKRAEWLLAAASVTRKVALVADAETEQANTDLNNLAATRHALVVADVVAGTITTTSRGDRVLPKPAEPVTPPLSFSSRQGAQTYAQRAQAYADAVAANAPAMATGGVVTQPTLALIGEAGPEAVIPLSKAGAMGTTNHITINTGADPNAVIQIIKRYTRNGGVL